MRIDHIALWTNNLEELKEFYCKYFNCTANEKYINTKKGFESYFLKFEDGARLELMKMTGIDDCENKVRQHTGFIHMAVSVGSEDGVNTLTEELRGAGYIVLGEPRKTGDGYYESCVADPDGNRIEITV